MNEKNPIERVLCLMFVNGVQKQITEFQCRVLYMHSLGSYPCILPILCGLWCDTALFHSIASHTDRKSEKC